MRHKTGLEAAQLIGSPDEETVHGGNAPAFLIRGEQLNQGMTDDHADVVHRPANEEHNE